MWSQQIKIELSPDYDSVQIRTQFCPDHNFVQPIIRTDYNSVLITVQSIKIVKFRSQFRIELSPDYDCLQIGTQFCPQFSPDHNFVQLIIRTGTDYNFVLTTVQSKPQLSIEDPAGSALIAV